MTQGERYARMCAKGWTSTLDAIRGGCGLTPLARWSEWSAQNWEHAIPGEFFGPIVYRLEGKLYKERTRERKVQNSDGTKVTIKERRLVRV